MDEMKQCSKCGQWKPATGLYFYKNRGVSSGLQSTCKECDSEQNRRWRKLNSDREKERKRLYRETHSDEEKERSRRWREANPVRARELQRLWREEHPENAVRWRKENPEKLRESKRRSHEKHREKDNQRTRRWYRANLEKCREHHRNYYKNNREKAQEYSRHRETLKHNLPFAFDAIDERRALEYFHGRCAVCAEPLRDLFGERIPHLDHWIALSDLRPDNPGTVPWNMVPLCSQCNQSKHAQDPVEWLQKTFGKRKARQITTRIEEYFEWIKTQDGSERTA